GQLEWSKILKVLTCSCCCFVIAFWFCFFFGVGKNKLRTL
ncbi:unnamed protein product, partial [Amoebophrya sp. A25]